MHGFAIFALPNSQEDEEEEEALAISYSILMAWVGSSCWRSRARAIHMRRSYDILQDFARAPLLQHVFLALNSLILHAN